MANHLSGGRLNVALLQETLRNELLSLLQKFEGPKAMIWDEWLASLILLVAQYPILRDNDVVDGTKLQSTVHLPNNVKHIIFIIRPKIALMDLVADVMLKSGQDPKKEFHIIFVPKKSELCEKHLTSRRVFGSFNTIEEFKCDIFPFDNDLMSLEFENDFRDYHLYGDPTCIYQSAVAIKRIEKLYGKIPKVIGVGQSAKQVWNVLCRLNKEDQNNPTKGPSQGCIDELLILDRSIDLASVFATQLTYEGLIDELFTIKNTVARFPMKKFLNPEERTANDSAVKEKKILTLNSSEEIFAKLRDKNFTYVGSALARKARLMHEQMVERRNNKSIQEIKEFVSKLPQMLANKQALANHTVIAEYVKEVTDSIDFHDILQCEEDFLNCVNISIQSPFIEDLIAQKAPLTQVLRLICLQCITSSGLKPKILDYYKRELVHVYGLNTWLGLCNLEKANILKHNSNIRQYTLLRKALNLTIDNSDTSEAKEKSYLNRTYTPVTVRLADNFCKNKGPYSLQDISNTFSAPVVDEIQAIPHGQNRRNSISSESSSIETTKVVVVFFIGGCTYSEISGLRALSQQEDSNVDFVIMTTKLINGNAFVESLLEPI